MICAILLFLWHKKQSGQKQLAKNHRHTPRAISNSAARNSTCINLDAFDEQDLPAAAVPLNAPAHNDSVWNLQFDDDDSCSTPQQHNANTADTQKQSSPSMTLASLIDAQNIQAQNRTEMPQNIPQRPRILGDSACELGSRYFNTLVETQSQCDARPNNRTNILIAQNALRAFHASATLSNGAVIQKIGENAACLFDPLESPISNIDRALSLLADFFDKKNIFIILANTDNIPDENLSHLGPIAKRFNIPKSAIYIEQPDGSFFNYIEDINDYIPARLAPQNITQEFFSKFLDYACKAYDEGDYDAILRSIAPILPPLAQHAKDSKSFPILLIAQALNLVGMTCRDTGNDDNAIAAFTQSLALLQRIEDYNAIKAVKANLGITLALSSPLTPQKLQLAIFHLKEVTNLDPTDDEAWLYLASSYIEQFKITNKQSLLGRAARAYRKAYEISANPLAEQCLAALERYAEPAACESHAPNAQTANFGNFKKMSR